MPNREKKKKVQKKLKPPSHLKLTFLQNEEDEKEEEKEEDE